MKAVAMKRHRNRTGEQASSVKGPAAVTDWMWDRDTSEAVRPGLPHARRLWSDSAGDILAQIAGNQ